MVNLLRKYQQTLMIAVTIMVIVAFVFLYNATRFDKISSDQAFRVYGRTLSMADIQRAARRSQLAMALGLKELVNGLGGGGYDQNQALENFVWNSFVLDHEARALGIAPTDAEVTKAMKGLAVFQTNKTFDPVKYQEVVQNLLNPNGFSDAQLEDLVRDELRIVKLKDLVGCTVDVTPEEFRAAYLQNHQKTDVSLIRFKLADFAAAIQPTEVEIKKYFDDHKNTLVTDEKRAVSYVQFALSESEKALKGKERVEAQQKLADKANEFGQQILDKKANFEEVAKKLGLKVETTPEFTESQPSPQFAAAPQVAAEAFRLTEGDPNSDAVQVETAFYILHLNKIVPSHPLTLDEAKPKIVDLIKGERGHDALVSKANEARAKLTVAVKLGKSFADAAKEAGLTVESFPPFSPMEPSDKPDASEIADKSVELAVGDVSELVALGDGGVLIHLDKMEPIDEAKFQKDQLSQVEMLRTRKRYAAFHEWLQLRRKGADVQNLQEPTRRPRSS